MSKYHQKGIDNIQKYISTYRWEEALKYLPSYCEKYKKDFATKLIYINTLIKTGNFTDARIILESTKVPLNELDTNYAYYFQTWVKLFILEQKYQECLDYTLDKNDLCKNEYEYYLIRGFCKKKLGQPVIKADYESYLYDQILDYQEERLKDNIKERYCTGDDLQYKEDFDIDKAYKIVKARLSESYKIYRHKFYYQTLFKCDNCGLVNNVRANYIDVSVINNSEDILFFTPSLNEPHYQYTDINEEYLGEKISPKKLSRINKFNIKYLNNKLYTNKIDT